LSDRAVALHASAAFTAIVHVERDPQRRRVAEVALLQSRAGDLTAVPAAIVDAKGDFHHGAAWTKLRQISLGADGPLAVAS
ncbi:MAG: hypothetical protein HGA51_07295, partial [Demequinaceae bacterium]|nr:hypothetical protein [Demequinaceae bacterium]